MPQHEADKPLSQEQRLAIFLALVEAQDGRMTVPQSRKAVAEPVGVTEQPVRRVQREALDGDWPPVG